MSDAERAFNCTPLNSDTKAVIDVPAGIAAPLNVAAVLVYNVTVPVPSETDVVVVNQKSGTDLYEIHVTAVAAGSFRISYKTTGGTTTEQPVFNFAVIKAVAG